MPISFIWKVLIDRRGKSLADFKVRTHLRAAAKHARNTPVPRHSYGKAVCWNLTCYCWPRFKLFVKSWNYVCSVCRCRSVNICTHLYTNVPLSNLTIYVFSDFYLFLSLIITLLIGRHMYLISFYDLVSNLYTYMFYVHIYVSLSFLNPSFHPNFQYCI